MRYKKIELSGDNWHAVHDLEEHVPFCLEMTMDNAGKIPPSLQIHDGAVIGELTEKMSLPEKAVMHEYMDVAGYKVETQSVVPFGSEPVIARKFEYLPSMVQVTTDVQLKRSIPAKTLEIDSLKLSGNWQRCAIINLVPDKPAPKKIKWINLKNSSTIYDSESHFHLFIIEDDNGNRLEIGAGFDLWRWDAGRRAEDGGLKAEDVPASEINPTVPPKGKFTIEYSKDSIIIRRQIFISETEFELHAQVWRFNWYIAWGHQESGGRSQKTGKGKQDTEKVDTPNFKFPVSSFNQCLHANTARNQLRKAVRSLAGKIKKETICLQDVEPRVCSNSSHVSRPGKEGIRHWDMTDIIDFWFWANRQLIKSESILFITPPRGSIFENLPSFGMMGREIN